MLDKLQKQICKTVGPSLAASLEPLAHRRNVASLSFFYGYYFGRCSSEVGIPEFLGSGRKSWTLGSGRWYLDAGLSTLYSGRWTLNLDAELSTLDSGH